MQNVLDELLSERKPETYVQAAELQRVLLREMLSRLELVTLQPHRVLDAGCAAGDGVVLLREHYPQASITAIDVTEALIAYAKNRAITNVEWLCAETTVLPLPAHSVDLIIANLVLPWCADLNALLREWQRVLRPNGLLMFTALGPDTLRELHELPLAFPQFIDMHDIGDLLMQAGFADPVLDADYFTFNYSDAAQLRQELQAMGMITGAMTAIQAKTARYEVIFGHAWGNSRRGANFAGEVHIPLSEVLRRRKSGTI